MYCSIKDIKFLEIIDQISLIKFTSSELLPDILYLMLSILCINVKILWSILHIVFLFCLGDCAGVNNYSSFFLISVTFLFWLTFLTSVYF